VSNIELAAQLDAAEEIIERGMKSFVEVGTALMQIRDERLYRETHGSFEGYCRDRWSFERAHAYRLIDASAVAIELSPIGDIPNESIARNLLAIKEPSRRRAVWKRITDRCRENGLKPTARLVNETVGRSRRTKRRGEAQEDWQQQRERAAERAEQAEARRRHAEDEFHARLEREHEKHVHPNTPGGNAARKAQALVLKALSTDSAEESHACLDKARELIAAHGLKREIGIRV